MKKLLLLLAGVVGCQVPIQTPVKIVPALSYTTCAKEEEIHDEALCAGLFVRGDNVPCGRCPTQHSCVLPPASGTVYCVVGNNCNDPVCTALGK